MTFTGTLLPYQDEVVDYMVEKQRMLVALDLGLGKTVLTIAACERLRDKGEIQAPTLVVVLASLKYQWKKEIHKFSDSNAIVIDGTKTQRIAQIRQAVQWKYNQIQYVITNYEAVVNDWSYISELEFDAIVMDEATAIKGFKAKRAKKTKDLARKVDIRYALTGTPVENGRPEEIYSIMQAVDGTVLGRFDHFDSAFIVRNNWGGVERYRNLDRLHSRLKPIVIRKTQSDPDVAPYLPDTIHREPELVHMDRKVRPVYNLVAERLIEGLEDAIGQYGSNFSVAAHYGYGQSNAPANNVMGELMSQITILRQLCSFPELVVESAHRYETSYQDLLGGGQGRISGSKTAWELMQDEEIAARLQGAKSPKLDVLEHIIKDHLETDEDAKVVVFTTFLTAASLIQARVGGVLYTGQMSATQKEDAKTLFQTAPEIRIFISTDAGGYGVDLPQANLLINHSLPWSSGTAVQRNGRIRRASSKWPSIVIQDLLVERSIEERQHDLLLQKTSVATAVVDGKGTDSKGGLDLSAGSLLAHLKATT
jgi:SNF2 family DNA or RNA helicase